MSRLKDLIHYILFDKKDKTLTKYYRYIGANIGEGCSFVGRNISFSSEPYLVTLGNNVRVSFDVAFVTHDGETHILRQKYPNISIYGTIEVGDNVFIGARSIIMPNVKIGSNCIVAAGSIVTKDVKENSIVAGVPAKQISSIDDYEKKHEREFMFIADYKYDEKKRILIEHFEKNKRAI